MKRFIIILFSLLFTLNVSAQIATSIAASSSTTNSFRFNPESLETKFAGWWKDEGNPNYLTDQLGHQEREAFTQNSLAGQVFSGRAIKFIGTADRALVADSGALDIGSNSAFSLTFWIKWDSFTGFQRVMGKIVNASTAGEYYLSTGSSGTLFNVRGTGGVQTVALMTPVVGTWYHVIFTIDASQVIRCYVDNVATGTTPTVSGSISSIANTHGFGLNCAVTSISSPTGYAGTTQFRDVRIFKGKVLSVQERTDCYDGKWVSGFTEWWPLSDNNTTRLHSAKNGGLHLTANSLDGGSLITGIYCRQIYNRYGYAENATYGQIPADLSTLPGANDTPTTDCYGNALVFSGSAKQNITKLGTDLVMFDDASSTQLDNLIRAAKQISRNIWFNGTTSQTITSADVAKYCGAMQYYNPSTKELVIIKCGHDSNDNPYALTASEEENLMSYMKLSESDVPTDYSAQMTSFLARCSGSYTNRLKNILDNFFRVNEISTADDYIETINAACWGTGTDQLLDLYNATFNLVDASLGRVDLVPYKGLVPQDGAYKNGWVASASGKFLQNDASMFVVAGDHQICPSLYPMAGADNTGVSGIFAKFVQGSTALQINHFLNDAAGTLTDLPSGVFNDDAFVINRVASGKNVYADGRIIGSSTSTSATRNSVEMHIGIRKTGTGAYITHQNYISIFGVGAAFPASVSVWFSDALYTLKSTMYARADEWLYTNNGNLKYKRTKYPYFPGSVSEDGTKRIWYDYYNIYYTNDGNGTHAVTASMAFNQNTLGWIHMGKLYDDGTFIFATSKNKCYLSSTALSSYQECSITKNGSPYIIHTPVNVLYPGEYFKNLGIYRKQVDTEGNEIFVWSNYGLSARGATPALLFFHRPEFGAEVKVVYEFGQSEYYTDNGTANGGTGGNPVGDASELLWCRHTHGTVQLPNDKTKFYMVTGDKDFVPGQYEFDSHHISFTADFDTNVFTKDVLFSGTRFSIAKAGSPDIYPDRPDFATIETDDTGGGLYIFNPNNVTGPESFTLVFDQESSPFNEHVPLWGMIDKKDSIYRYLGLGFVRTPPVSGEFSFPSITYSMNMDEADSYIPEAKKTPGNVLPTMIQHIGNNKYMIWNAEFYDFYAGSQCEIIEFVN